MYSCYFLFLVEDRPTDRQTNNEHEHEDTAVALKKSSVRADSSFFTLPQINTSELDVFSKTKSNVK